MIDLSTLIKLQSSIPVNPRSIYPLNISYNVYSMTPLTGVSLLTGIAYEKISTRTKVD